MKKITSIANLSNIRTGWGFYTDKAGQRVSAFKLLEDCIIVLDAKEIKAKTGDYLILVKGQLTYSKGTIFDKKHEK